MARNPELEAILQAWFDLETGAPAEQSAKRSRLDALLEQSISNSGKTNVSKRDLMVAMRDEYRVFAKAKHIEMRQRMSRLK